MVQDDWNRPLTKAEMAAIRAAAAEPGESAERRIRSQFWVRFRRIARHVPYAEDVLAAFYCATDPLTPLRVKAVLFAGLAYLLWPTNLVPRVAIALGVIDEAAVLLVTVRSFGQAIKPEHRARAREVLAADWPTV
jgi:uncharacterized membrane protein YkvA (DUF1232 family)